MPATTLDPRTALIVIDLQQGIVALPVAHPIADVIANTVSLLQSFRSHHLPVVLVNVDAGAPGRTDQPRRLSAFPDGWTTLIPQLNPQPSDILITKQTYGAFRNTGLEDTLNSLGVTQIVLTGVSTSGGVESTARNAHEAGFHVTLATDAMTDMNLEAHHNSITRIFPRIGETATTAQIITLLETTHP